MVSKSYSLVDALYRRPVDRTPMWIMRQAGRYLPEYRAVRAQAGDFLTLCQTPELACEVTLQPLQRFDLDAAIIFSDILTIPDAMGLGLQMKESVGPVFERPLKTPADIDAVTVPDMESELGYVTSAIKLVKRELGDRKPLIGFSGSPWTLATYMVEGQSTKTFSKVKKMLYAEPAAMRQLLKTLSTSVSEYLLAQRKAGCDALMIFDTWGGVLTPATYREFSLSPMQDIVNQLKSNPEMDGCPIVLFTKNGGLWLDDIVHTGCEGIGLDWTVDLASVAKRFGDRVALQGNLDPAVLYSPDEVIRAEVKRIMTETKHCPGHVFNLGHGILPDVNPDKVSVLVDAVRTYGTKA